MIYHIRSKYTAVGQPPFLLLALVMIELIRGLTLQDGKKL